MVSSIIHIFFKILSDVSSAWLISYKGLWVKDLWILNSFISWGTLEEDPAFWFSRGQNFVNSMKGFEESNLFFNFHLYKCRFKSSNSMLNTTIPHLHLPIIIVLLLHYATITTPTPVSLLLPLHQSHLYNHCLTFITSPTPSYQVFGTWYNHPESDNILASKSTQSGSREGN